MTNSQFGFISRRSSTDTIISIYYLYTNRLKPVLSLSLSLSYIDLGCEFKTIDEIELLSCTRECIEFFSNRISEHAHIFHIIDIKSIPTMLSTSGIYFGTIFVNDSGSL